MQMTYVAPNYSAGIRPPVWQNLLTGSSWNQADVPDHQAKLYGFDAACFQKPKVSRLFIAI